MKRKKQQRRPPTLRDVELRIDLQRAKEQVDTGTRALNNPDIKPELRDRLEKAIRYWERRIDEITKQIEG